MNGRCFLLAIPGTVYEFPFVRGFRPGRMRANDPPGEHFGFSDELVTANRLPLRVRRLIRATSRASASTKYTIQSETLAS